MESPYQYADRILPKLFSETNSLVLHYRDLLSKGGFLNTKHIANIKAVYLEEVGDVHSLWFVVSHDFGKQVSIVNERTEVELLEIQQKSNLYLLSIQNRLQEVLSDTSIQMVFFADSIRFFEEYEAEKGIETIPQALHEQIFSLLQKDYINFLYHLEVKMNQGSTMLQPIDQNFVSEFNIVVRSGSESEENLEHPSQSCELGKIALNRAMAAGTHRKELNALFKAFENCFAIVAKRALRHKMTISLIQFSK